MGAGGGSAPAPKVVTPGEAAQAAVGTAGAGEEMSIANQPIEQLANLSTSTQLGPAEVQSQQALAGQAALQSAQQQQAIQAQTDPMAYAQRQMRLQAATDRLGQLYNVNPSAYTYGAGSAFMQPGTSGVPTAEQLRAQSAALASNLQLASVNKQGTDPRLNQPNNPQTPAPIAPSSYLV